MFLTTWDFTPTEDLPETKLQEKNSTRVGQELNALITNC
jgi:hypothetical protein